MRFQYIDEIMWYKMRLIQKSWNQMIPADWWDQKRPYNPRSQDLRQDCMILDDIGSDGIGWKKIWSVETKWHQLNFDSRTDEIICVWKGSN